MKELPSHVTLKEAAMMDSDHWLTQHPPEPEPATEVKAGDLYLLTSSGSTCRKARFPVHVKIYRSCLGHYAVLSAGLRAPATFLNLRACHCTPCLTSSSSSRVADRAPRDQHRDHDRDNHRDQDRDHHRDRDHDRDHHRDLHRDHDHDRDHDRDQNHHRDRDQNRDHDHHRDYPRDHDRDQNRDQNHHRDRDQNRDHDHDRDHHRDTATTLRVEMGGREGHVLHFEVRSPGGGGDCGAEQGRGVTEWVRAFQGVAPPTSPGTLPPSLSPCIPRGSPAMPTLQEAIEEEEEGEEEEEEEDGSELD